MEIVNESFNHNLKIDRFFPSKEKTEKENPNLEELKLLC